MSTPFECILADKPFDEVQRTLAHASPDQVEQAAAGLTPEQREQVRTYTDKTMQSARVLDALVCGAMFYLLLLIDQAGSYRERFDELLEELGISRTQAYRCRGVWCCFGRALTETPGLKRKFRPEALKILSEASTPQMSRNEALQRARDGELITIQIALALKAQHAETAEIKPPLVEPLPSAPTSESPTRRTRQSHKWLFVGDAARIEVIPTATQGPPDVEALIRDLEAAIAQLRHGGSANQVA